MNRNTLIVIKLYFCCCCSFSCEQSFHDYSKPSDICMVDWPRTCYCNYCRPNRYFVIPYRYYCL